jgi:uncharacterized protein
MEITSIQCGQRYFSRALECGLEKLGIVLCLLLWVAVASSVCAAEVAPVPEPAPATVLEIVREGDLVALKKLLAEGLSPDAKDKWGTPLISMAAKRGHESIVRLLLEHGASPSVAMRGSLPLHFAAEGGNTNLINLFLEKGNPLNATMDMGASVFYFTVSKRHFEAAKLLLEKGADPNLYRPPYNYPRLFTPLAQAIYYEDREMVELLLKYGADVNAPDNTGAPSYFQACMLDSTSLLELMLSKGAKPDFVSREGSTPLMWAASAGSLANVKLLVGKGAKIDRTTRVMFSMNQENALTARDMAIISKHKEVADYLAKADPASSKVRIHIIK